jgi:hypothetical protein
MFRGDQYCGSYEGYYFAEADSGESASKEIYWRNFARK